MATKVTQVLLRAVLPASSAISVELRCAEYGSVRALEGFRLHRAIQLGAQLADTATSQTP
jgi:hypothetical protein